MVFLNLNPVGQLKYLDEDNQWEDVNDILYKRSVPGKGPTLVVDV